VASAAGHRPYRPDLAHRVIAGPGLPKKCWPLSAALGTKVKPSAVPAVAPTTPVTASTGAVAILLSQLELAGPTPPGLMREFWQHAVTT
jgi:hypothetical protein